MNEGERPVSSGVPAVPPAPQHFIRISAEPDRLIEQWADDLLNDRLQVWQLPRGLAAFWWMAWNEGAASRQEEVDRANADADRFYRQLFNPTKTLKPGPSYGELERIRGNPEHAERYEKWLNDLLDGFGRSTT